MTTKRPRNPVRKTTALTPAMRDVIFGNRDRKAEMRRYYRKVLKARRAAQKAQKEAQAQQEAQTINHNMKATGEKL